MKFCSINIAARAFWSAVYPAKRPLPSEWAEQNRTLSPEESDEPGPYTFDRTPYWRDVCDWFVKSVEEITVLKGAQVGYSELIRNITGYCIDVDPGPTMFLMSDQKSAEDFRIERLEPLITNTEAIKAHVSPKRKHNTKHRIRFRFMSLFMAWAGSSAGVKSRPIRFLFCEEPDEFPPFSSTGGDPLAKADKRLTVAKSKGRARKVIGGTPTTRRGNVWKSWEMCTAKMHFWVPCPHCNGYQELHWKGVKWPESDEPDRKKRAEKIKTESLAYYECEHCQKEIHDHQKPPMLRRGLWASEDQVVTRDGRVVGPAVTAKRVGFFLPSTYSPWVSFSQLAEEWLNAQDDVQMLCDFINQRLAQPFEETREKTEPSLFHEKAKAAGPPMLVPKWTTLLVATADTQGNNDQDGYFWYTIRAWTNGYRSQLVDYGIANSKAELIERTINARIPFEGGGTATPQILLVDSGGPRWFEIYQLAQSDGRIKPTKGASGRQMWMVQEKLQKTHGVILWLIDTEQSKDTLHRLVHDPDPSKWLPHKQIDDQYADQLASEAKLFDPQTGKEEWKPLPGQEKNNHLLDCEHQQVVAAWRFGMGIPPAPEKTEQSKHQASESANEPRKWVDRNGSWL